MSLKDLKDLKGLQGPKKLVRIQKDLNPFKVDSLWAKTI
jgi:hypothetical protein